MIACLRLAWPVAVIAAVCGFTVACGGQPAAPRPAIFWTQSPHGGSGERGNIGRAEMTGSGINGRFIVGAKAPAGIATNGRYIYWANYGSGTIARARLDGSGVNERFINGAQGPIGIAVDSEHIYWTNSDRGTIGRANLNGSGVNQHFIKAGAPMGLAVDGDHIYWTHSYSTRNDTVYGYAIGRANLDGSGVSQRFIDASNKLTGVAVNGRYIYWSNDGEDAIGRANLDGAAVEQRCITAKNVPVGNVPEGLAVDGQHVYWANYPADTIGRANLDGLAVNEHFIPVKGVPEGIAVPLSTDANSSTLFRGACRDMSKAPILFGPTGSRAGYYGAGWGEVAPPTISNGGAAASGTVFQIHWSSWGGRTAVGRGLNPTYAPQGGYYPKPVVMELRASAIRRCKPGSQLVYTRFTAREQVRPGGPMGKWFAWAPNMCADPR